MMKIIAHTFWILEVSYKPMLFVTLRCFTHLKIKQVAQWATIAHLRASIMFGDTIIDDVQRQVTLNLKQ